MGNRAFKCASHAKGGHGEVDISKAFAYSCNTYFINLMMTLSDKNGVDMHDEVKRGLISMAEKFSLGSATGLEAQGIDEAKGQLPDADEKMQKGDLANMAIGQGVMTATPLQAVNIASIIASGGIKYNLNVVDAVLDPQGNVIENLKKEDEIRVIDPKTAEKIKENMKMVTEDGYTGAKANADALGGVAGKTGTAQTGQYKGGKEIENGWFTGFFPYENPKYAMCVFIEGTDSKSKSSSEIFGEIAKLILTDV